MAIKERLASGQLLLGTFLVELASPGIPRILAHAGFDFFIIDREHGLFTTEATSRLIAGARAAGIAPLVRVPEIARAQILGALEAGAEGIVAPMIETPQDAEELFRFAKYPPLGERGTCLGTAHTDYAVPEAASYLATANEDTFLVGQIETRRGVQNLDSILSVRKLDLVFVGPLDLSVSLGAPGDYAAAGFEHAVDAILRKGRECGIPVGAFAANSDRAVEWIERGCRMVACSADLFMLAEQSRALVEAIRGESVTEP